MKRLYFPLFFFFIAIFAMAGFAYDNGIVPINTPESARRLIEHLIKTNGEKFPKGEEFLKRLEPLEAKLKENPNDGEAKTALEGLIREASLANPVLDAFEEILLVRRKPKGGYGFMALNSYTNDTVRRTDWDNDMVLMSDFRSSEPKLKSIYRHPNTAIMRDTNLHFDGKRIIFSSINEFNNWAVFEVDIEGNNVKELTPNDQKDVLWWDACYLPEDDYIICASTAGMQGLPCENGGRPMCNLYRVNTKTKEVRQLTFEQDSDWHPSMMHDGRVMYLRWEYSDTPHYMSRILFAMNPDGRNQRAIFGSGSLFPTAYKNPRVVPNHPSLVIGVVSGHHTGGSGTAETGRLLLVDPRLGTKYPFRNDPETKEWGPENTELNVFPRVYPKEVTGCVQEIPGWGRDVVGNVYDNQGGQSSYRFVYPFPLDENFYLVSLRVKNKGQYGLWLVDRFDNMTKIMELPDYSLFQPIPVMATEKPPVQRDATIADNPEGVMFITDVNIGHGLPEIPAGKAKKLRIFSYHFGYWNSGGHESVGQESSWDIKRILGTVDVEDDGSASFVVPANTPISIQVLDEDNAAIQLMRSWTVCMPGESLACVGCHEDPRDATPPSFKLAGRKAPQEIKPWYGPHRPFGYEAEIQPMLEEKCIGCHNDVNKETHKLISFEARNTGDWRTDTSYTALNPYVRRPGPETELEPLKPMEYHVGTSELIQRLRRGHFGVELNEEQWDRFHTWIDLNAPYRGQWSNPRLEKRRLELAELYAGGLDTNPEEEYRTSLGMTAAKEIKKMDRVSPEQIAKLLAPKTDNVKAVNWPFDETTARKMQGEQQPIVIELGKDHRGIEQKIKLVRIPAGDFVMGSLDGFPDEAPRSVVKVEKPFWMATTETTNSQYNVFDPEHDTRYLKEDGKDHIVPGYIANHPDQPVARLSWNEAMEFCKWLSEKSGKKVTLPTEAQWEWAARAGTETPFFYGDRDTDFSKWANLADAGLRRTYTSWDGGSKVHLRRNYNGVFPLRDDRFTDKWFVVDYVAQYEPSPWGLYDIIGNACEWTRSEYKPYPYAENDGRNDGNPETKKVARGGSWNDRPKVTGSALRIPYESYQKVHNVGFRIVVEE